MSGKTDSAENMFNGIKPYKELNSIQKIARKYDDKRKCTNCNYKGLCPNDVLIVCMQSFEKGFVTGVKYHRKVVKERTENKISKIFRISYKEIKEKLIKYFKDSNYGYFAEVPREDIIEFLNSK